MTKRFFKAGLALLMAGVVFLASCEKEELIQVIGTLQGVAYDGNTNAPIEGVTVEVMKNGEKVTATSTVDGFTLTEFPSGEYTLTFKKEGYTTVVAEENVPQWSGQQSTVKGGGNYYVTRTVNPVLYTMDGAVSGTVFKDVSGKKLPASGVKVVLSYDSPNTSAENTDGRSYGITPNSYEATTNSDGMFSFSAVPAAPVSLYLPGFNDGTTDFSGFSLNLSLVPGQTYSMGERVVYSANSAPAVVEASTNSTNMKMEPDANITLTFNTDLDQAKSFFQFFDNWSGEEIDVAVSYAKGLTTVSLDPQELLKVGNQYRIYYEVYSTTGMKSSSNYYFNTVDGIEYVNSNLEETQGNFTEAFGVADNIVLTFNIAPNEAITLTDGYVNLYDNNTGYKVDATVTFSGNTVTINPVENLKEDNSYSVQFRVYSSYPDDSYANTYYFSTVNNTVAPATAPTMTIDMGTDWKANYNTTSVTFEFSRIANAESYEVWAKDSYKNSDWVRISTPSDAADYSQATLQTVNTSLPWFFDYFEDDGYQTPFSYGTTVSYKMRAVNDAGYGPWSAVVTIKDETAFSSSDMYFESVYGYLPTPYDYYTYYYTFDADGNFSSVDNSAGTSTKQVYLTMKISSGRYADVTKTPTVLVYDTGNTNPAVGATASGVWVDHQTLKVTMSINATINAKNMYIRVGGVNDSSGNTMEVDYESRRVSY